MYSSLKHPVLKLKSTQRNGKITPICNFFTRFRKGKNSETLSQKTFFQRKKLRLLPFFIGTKKPISKHNWKCLNGLNHIFATKNAKMHQDTPPISQLKGPFKGFWRPFFVLYRDSINDFEQRVSENIELPILLLWPIFCT